MTKFTLAFALATLFFPIGCKKQSNSRWGPLTTDMPTYSYATFVKFPNCECQLMEVHVGSYTNKLTTGTNFFVTIFLERTNGEQFAISENQAPEDLFHIINTLEKGHSYIFPNVLTNRTLR